MTMELHATPADVMRAVEALQQLAQSLGVPDNIIFALALALEECGSNIVKYALQRDPERTFYVTFEHTDHALHIELRDRGPEFDPTAAVDRKPQAEDEDVPGGWGIPLVRRQMDEIRYRRESGENILRLTKHLTSPSAGH